MRTDRGPSKHVILGPGVVGTNADAPIHPGDRVASTHSVYPPQDVNHEVLKESYHGGVVVRPFAMTDREAVILPDTEVVVFCSHG